ncbi:putative acyl-activating enzyme 1, peroxisomal [Mycena kentingensis (nom. inval.)]|nr:putative acyl-activating enzyme 1, peroxisomal [Mycena kentingensis (nom. inval.)]
MFVPTAASIPPHNAGLSLRHKPGLPVNMHPLNPLEFLLRAANLYPNKVALVAQPVSYTFSIWCQRVQNLAYALIQRNIKPGDRVAVIAPNCPMVADACNASLAAQAILCMINTRLKPSEVAYILEHSGSSIILVDHEYTHLVPRDTKVPVIICNDTGRLGDPYEDFLATGRAFSQEKGWGGLEYCADENAGVMLCYTSGTTGRPKGVLTTLRGSYLAAVANAYESKIYGDSTYLWILPMFHAAGWTFPWANTFACATQITMRAVDYPQIWKHFLHSRVTHYCGAPTVQIGIVNDPAARPLKRKINAIIAGAAPTASLIGSLESIGIQPIHVYGLTWVDPTNIPFPTNDMKRGHAFATAENVRVVYQPKEDNDITLMDVPRDGRTIGEVVTRGNIVMKEYFRDPEATKMAFRGGSFNTGDLAVWNKDVLRVLRVAVVARSHAKWGERPHAFVILKPSGAKKWKHKHDKFEADLKAHAKQRLPGFASPEWVQVVDVDGLPKNGTGKVVKAQLRKIVAKL